MFTPYAQTVGDLPPPAKIKSLLKLAKSTLDSLEGISDCHTAAQKFVADHQTGTVVRGYLYPNFEHSWVDMGTFILDIYPVGGCQPHLVVTKVAYRGLYIRNLVEQKGTPPKFVATRDIKSGEEVSTDYITYLELADAKQASLQKP
jgi:hypothetical protein